MFSEQCFGDTDEEVHMKRLELNFDGRTVLITGAATGIGRATALAFAAARAAVLIGDVDPRAEDTVREIIASGGKAVFQKTDVSDSAQVQALVARAVSEFGALDVAFNNAGLLPPTAPLAEQTEDDWDRIMRVDVTGVFLCLKHELAQMAKAGYGVIVNTASVAGLRADPGMAPYVAAKHAVVGLTKAAAIDYAASGIRVNAIAPGLVRTPMTERWLNDPQMRDRVLADSPIRRAAEPEDIAGLVLFLVSDLANVITGAVYPVDGARTAH
jgi:NAD(P)-dependent dehydrogenase (short-subunit alcohol dehydrogenase family)